VLPDAPIPYRLRVSPRARNVSLRVTVDRGLEVIVPEDFDPVHVPGILDRMGDWVRRALARAEANRLRIEPELPWQLPREISLLATGAKWEVIANESTGVSVSIRDVGHRRLSITGALHDEGACRAALGRWLVRRARRDLIPRLDALSEQLGLRCRRVLVRLQRSRWGSCSSKKVISLNAKLLLLPPALVRSVLIHELCHLAEMNHSARFWSLVARHDPDSRVHRKSLREAWRSMPPWAR
jgi:predicted metal-dependent hydrolase